MPNHPKVLLVDDEEVFCASLLKSLTIRKITAAAVNRGQEALAEIARNDYDVILLDVMMPGISGIDVLKQLKENGSSSEVIVLSGHASMDVALDVLKYGAYDYLLKPCDLDELLVKISRAYEQRLEKHKLHKSAK